MADVTTPEKVRAHGFIVFLLGMFLGRYGLPLMTHLFYITIIALLLFKQYAG